MHLRGSTAFVITLWFGMFRLCICDRLTQTHSCNLQTAFRSSVLCGRNFQTKTSKMFAAGGKTLWFPSFHGWTEELLSNKSLSGGVHSPLTRQRHALADMEVKMDSSNSAVKQWFRLKAQTRGFHLANISVAVSINQQTLFARYYAKQSKPRQTIW